MFLHEMGVTTVTGDDGTQKDTQNYYDVFKVNSNISKYGITGSMPDKKSNFDNLIDYLNEWENTKFNWDEIWDNFAAVIYEYVDDPKKKIIFMDHLGDGGGDDANDNANDSLSLDKMVPLVKQEFRYPEYVEWVKEKESPSIKTVILELILSPEHTIFRTADANVKIRYTTTYPQIGSVQINRITGNGTTFDGVLRADNIEPTAKDGTTKFKKGDFQALSVGGQAIKPTEGTTPMNMSFKTGIYVLYKDKVFGPDKSTDTNPLSLIDENGNKKNFDCPDITLDYNFCGNVYFFSVRTFTIAREPLIKEYVGDTSTSPTGFGRFSLPIAINPYSFPIMARQRQGVKDEEITPFVVTNITENYIITCIPNAANYYQVATTRYTHILYEINKDTGEVRYRTVYKGNIAFITTEKANKFLNLEWLDVLPKYKVDAAYKVKNEFIVVEGFNFRAIEKNNSEKIGYYTGVSYD